MDRSDSTTCATDACIEKLRKKVSCLCQQVKDYEQQLESTQMQLDNACAHATQCSRELEDLSRKLCQRDDALVCQEGKIEELKKDMKEKERCSQRSIDCLQEKLCQATEQYQQRDSALQCCKADLTNYMTQLEETKNSMGCIIQQRESCMGQMEQDMNQMTGDLRCKSDQISAMERELCDLKSKYHQVCSSLKECDTRNGCMNEKVQALECQANRDKAQFTKELEELDCRNRQLCENIKGMEIEMRSLKRCLQEKEEDLDCCKNEKEGLCRELAKELEESRTFRERYLTCESDNKEICLLLQQKNKRNKDLEEMLNCKCEELEQCQSCVDELRCRLRQLKTTPSKELDKDEGECPDFIDLKMCISAGDHKKKKSKC